MAAARLGAFARTYLRKAIAVRATGEPDDDAEGSFPGRRFHELANWGRRTIEFLILEPPERAKARAVLSERVKPI
jgi:hypothetical protein